MAVSLGTSTGLVLSGILFQLAGYWVAWASAFTVIGVDIVFRLLVLEKSHTKEVGTYSQFSKHDSISDRATLKDVSEDYAERASNSEYSPLLSTQYDESAATYPVSQKVPNFYRCIFNKLSFAGAVWCSFMFGFLITIFNATVPLHVRDEFDWGGMQSGHVFAALQAPRLVMSPLVGWLKDRVGTRTPTAFGFAVLAPLIWLSGIPGNEHFPFAN